jgi:hypothetical protein
VVVIYINFNLKGDKQMEKAILFKHKDPTCAELVKSKFKDVEDTWKKAEQFYQEFDNEGN